MIGTGQLKMFEEGRSMWDEYRGKQIPEEAQVGVCDIEGLDALVASLSEAKWRFNTRATYNRWFKCWQSFAKVSDCQVAPASEVWFMRFLVFLMMHYAAGTVQICAAAVKAMHTLNGLESPITPRVKMLLKAIEAVGMCGVRSKKFIVDSAFVVAMSTDFVRAFPVFDAKDFQIGRARDARDASKSIMWMRGVAMILLGLEIGARASEIANMTTCCWQSRSDGSVFVVVQLAKNGKNGELTGAVLVPGSGKFEDDFSAVSFFREYWFPFLEEQGWGVSDRCESRRFKTCICRMCSPMFPVCKEWVDQPKNVSRAEVTSAVKKWATKIGRDAAHYSAISFRRGSVSIAAAAKVDRNIRKKHCRWKSDETQDVYTEVSSSEAQEFGKALRSAVMRSKRAKGKKVMFQQ